MDKSTTKITIITACVIVALFVLTLVLIIEFIQINNLKAKKLALENEIEANLEDINTYNSASDYMVDRETYMQNLAHELYNWTTEDELIFTGN